MKNYIKHDPWKIIEKGFNPDYNRVSESIFSLGNGKFGQRGNFEEDYSGDSLSGNYVAGVYYPDKTRVGWWKNGYPEYFAKVLNAPEWMRLRIIIQGELLDLANCEVKDFERVLDMKEGILYRKAHLVNSNGVEFKIESKRACSIANDSLGILEYKVSPISRDVDISIESFVNGNVRNEDSNYGEHFWTGVDESTFKNHAFVQMRTRKTNFGVSVFSHTDVYLDDDKLDQTAESSRTEYASNTFELKARKGQTVRVEKFVTLLSTLYHQEDELFEQSKKTLIPEFKKGMKQLFLEQAQAWAKKWDHGDMEIGGDTSAQQAIRFNIFQLNQTYTGADARLNIGPKGFTGEKYGGSTYWDTEAYCLPFYLNTAPREVSRNLLIYRHKHLTKAIENAQKLGFKNGAALYPMVTMNGEECHNEWEITFEEIHRNGAIAFAIYDYIRYTGDDSYLSSHGLDVLIAISRFWAQRVNWSEDKQAYVMLGVTGPNEFENNVSNNWYTNYIATWCLRYTLESIEAVRGSSANVDDILSKNLFREEEETKLWKEIIDKMYYPSDAKRGVFLQQDGFLDKDLTPARELRDDQLPIVENWSWDRILRSCYIKQADVLQGLYFFEEEFSKEEIEKNFDFYEPLTVHESSLSPCIHSILAAAIDRPEKAYEFYLRTGRLDLDDYNNDTCDGLHITSMAGSWMSVTKGFAGMRVKQGKLEFNPILPEGWTHYTFKINFRGHQLSIRMDKNGLQVKSDKDGLNDIIAIQGSTS